MSEVYDFVAWDYFADGQLRQVPYTYAGDTGSGWEIIRAGKPYLTLEAGYAAVASRYCGICSTDLQRQHLPFALPQVTGHEVVGERDGQSVVLEINASHWHRGVPDGDCWYCRHGYANHCPQRLTLGIDRLPGGFAPWVLVPLRAIHVLPAILQPASAILVEPLAAALHAVQVTPPRDGDRVAVLGCGRLGLLLIAALAWQRRLDRLDFDLCALTHRPGDDGVARQLGADEVRMSAAVGDRTFDIVFEASGRGQGFAQALAMARRCVHVKSTSGEVGAGLTQLTRLVVNEYQLVAGQAVSSLQTPSCGDSPVASMDLPDLEAVDRFLAAVPAPAPALRPGGCIRLDAPGQATAVERALAAGVEIQSSRCGAFAPAIDFLVNNAKAAGQLEKRMITRDMPVASLPEAFAAARRPGALKVRVFH